LEGLDHLPRAHLVDLLLDHFTRKLRETCCFQRHWQTLLQIFYELIGEEDLCVVMLTASRQYIRKPVNKVLSSAGKLPFLLNRRQQRQLLPQHRQSAR
jgi:hypothetical protein